MAFGRIKVGAVLERRGILLAFPVVFAGVEISVFNL